MTTTTAFAPDRQARGVAIKTGYENLGGAGTRFRPARIAVLAQGSEATTYDTTKEQVFSASYVGNKYGYTSPLYAAVSQLLPVNGDGVGGIPVEVLPLAQPSSGGAQAAGTITPSGTQTKQQSYYIKVNNIRSQEIVMAIGDTVADFTAAAAVAVNAITGMPCIGADGTTVFNFTAGWEGATGDDIYLEVESPDDAEMTFVIVQPTGGAGTVDITAALAQLGESVWTSHIVNALAYNDATLLNEYQTFGVGRWQPEVHKPCTVYTGTSEATLSTVTTVTDARKTDKVNVIIPNPGSNDLPVSIAARAVARIAVRDNNDPARDYGSLELTGLTAPLESSQWTSAQRDTAVKAGCATTQVKNGVVCLSDVVTCYHPDGEEPAPYAYVCDISKISTVIYNTSLIFDTEEWDGAPLVPNDQAIKSTSAKKPKMALSALTKMYVNLAWDAIISDPDFAIENTTADIGTTNPKRLDIKEVFKLGGNANVISIDLGFGFYYGG